MAEQAQKWADSLIDLGYRNTLLYFRDTKLGTVDLTTAPAQAVASLLAGQKTRLGLLFPEPDDHKNACNRARNLRRKIVELDEEQGIDAGRLALGLVHIAAPTTRGTSPVPALRAPLLLVPLAIRPRTVSENDFVLEIDGEPEINPVLLYALSRQYGMDADIDDLSEKINTAIEECAEPGERPQAAYRILADKLAPTRLPIQLEDRTVAGIFSFDRLPMVNDLRASTMLLAGHPVIAALAGDQSATAALRSGPAGFTPAGADDIEPKAEFLVLDADASQQRAISTVSAGHHIVIEGPPGTGKSQTIANVIAALAASGKRILFVAEKRAAIEAVTDRLARVDLAGLVFDLHENKLNRRLIAQQLQDALERAGGESPPARDDLHERLAHHRGQARLHVNEFHREHDPWQVSAYETLTRLAGFPPERRTRVRLRGSLLSRLHGADLRQTREDLHEYVAQRGLAIRRGESAWARTTARTDEQISGALAGLDHLTGRALRDTRDEIEGLIDAAGLRRAVSISQWQFVLTLMHDVAQTVADFTAEVFQPGLEHLVTATATGAWRKANNRPMGWWQRRGHVKRARMLRQDGVRDRSALHADLYKAQVQNAQWKAASLRGDTPFAVPRLDEAMAHFGYLRDQLTAVALCARIDDLEVRSTDEVAEKIRQLDDDRATLTNMPRLNVLNDRLESAGLRQLLDELAEQDADPETAIARFDFAWWSSLLDEFGSRSPHIRAFTSRQHEHHVGGFQQSDLTHLEQNAKRVRYRVATALRQVRDANPEQSALVRDQAHRKIRHLPLRRLVERAPDVLLAAKPCWAMSPLVVSRVLPAVRLFDVVVFDEASQIPPCDAITSIMRARQVVVAGDPHQLPPTSFFTRMVSGSADEDEEEDENAAPEVFESLLEMLSGRLPHQCNQRLRWHYRSSDERLIAFSNRNIYANDLVTFPGTAVDSPIRLDVVDGTVPPGQKGSTPEEVERVVSLVLEHAEQRPDQSLGVIAMGHTHADRIQHALRRTLTERPELDSFFSQERGPGKRFFVKNLERVQGDERDAIILSLGYAKSANGRLPMRFGPLNLEGGERRLNVAITRARKSMTVVASFSHEDFDPDALAAVRNPGPELLRRFVEYCARRGDLARVEHHMPAYELNPFEQQVLDSIRRAGITVVPQWGVSDYRIDFALGHPERPGQMVLAVETDGNSYHSAASVRDRDRLRQAHLENLGWRFHRIWAAEWYRDPASAAALVVDAWRTAVRAADDDRDRRGRSAKSSSIDDGVVPTPAPPTAPGALPARGPRPPIAPGGRIADYSRMDLRRVARWLLSDGYQLDRDTRIGQAMAELGFQKRGKLIVEALNSAFDEAQRDADREQR